MFNEQAEKPCVSANEDGSQFESGMNTIANSDVCVCAPMP